MVDPVDQGLEFPGFRGHLDIHLEISRPSRFITIIVIIIIVIIITFITIIIIIIIIIILASHL